MLQVGATVPLCPATVLRLAARLQTQITSSSTVCSGSVRGGRALGRSLLC